MESTILAVGASRFSISSRESCVLGSKQWCVLHGIPKSVRTDNAKEFKESGAAWRVFCLERGIVRRHSPPYEPEANGKVERLNRTLTDATRCVLEGVDRLSWGHAAKCVAFVWNRVERRRQKSPFFVRFGRQPSVVFFRKFGCVCFSKVHVRKKLDAKYEKCVFLGYSVDSPAYLVGYFSSTGKFETIVLRKA